MDGTQLLGQLVSALASGAVEVVDLSAPLGPETPLIKLPPEIGRTPRRRDPCDLPLRQGRAVLGVELAEARRAFRHAFRRAGALDQRQGPSEQHDRHHSVKNFVGPACVIDCSAGGHQEQRLSAHRRRGEGMEKAHGDIAAGSWVLMRTDWYKRNSSEAKFLNVDDKGPHSPGPTAETIHYLISKGVMGWGSRPSAPTPVGRRHEPPFPAHTFMHRPTATASPACATSTGCRPRARS
jgi:kynurenine formamidase